LQRSNISPEENPGNEQEYIVWLKDQNLKDQNLIELKMTPEL
jgi:hypothetical protein